MEQIMPEIHQKTPDILIVDDTPANLQLLAGMLKEHGYRVRPVPSGKLAIQAVQKEKPDLILLDINMPEMNGYEVCEHLKADDALKEIPVLFISALDETIDKIKAFAAGGVDYVTKPFQFEEVEARVQTHLHLRRLQIELERQNRQLQESYCQLRKLEDLRDNLTDMIVHDMRAPLTVVNMSYEIITTTPKNLSPTQKALMTAGKNACHKLIEMVTTLLDVSRIEAGEMPINRAPCDILEIAQKAAESVAVLAREEALTLRVTGDSASGVVDRDITHRIFVNLLGNAIKFSPKGGTIGIDISSAGETVRVTVADQGPGIPPEYHQRIFEKFGQVESREENKQYSTGLGLTFCKMAVEAQGGQIGIKSPSTLLRAGEVGKGSTFWFTLPARKDGTTNEEHRT
jgi:signal transduction histidine kinase